MYSVRTYDKVNLVFLEYAGPTVNATPCMVLQDLPFAKVDLEALSYTIYIHISS